MAVDTRNKRASACAVHWQPLSPLPDGSIGDADRQQLAGVYSGLVAIAPEPGYDYDGRVTHITVDDGAVTAASNEPYIDHMDWEDRP